MKDEEDIETYKKAYQSLLKRLEDAVKRENMLDVSHIASDLSRVSFLIYALDDNLE